MDQKDFDQILERYLCGKATMEEEELVEKWYSSIQDSDDKVGIIEKLLLKWRMRRKLDAHKSIKYSRDSSSVFFDLQPLFRFSLVALAATSVAVMSYLFLIVPPDRRPDNELAMYSTERTVSNTGNSVKVVLLPDGSHVSLNAGATLHFPASFNKVNREVFLREGEALFEVARDVSRPFFVYTDNVVTRVLGTSFTVDVSRPDVVVAVKSGSVSVFTKNDSINNGPDQHAELVLAPNQQAIYDPRKGRMSLRLVEKPTVVLPAEDLKEMHFESTRVPLILEAVAKAYGVNIAYDHDLLSSCILTTFVNENEDLYERLQIICEAIGATYQVEGTQIKIIGSGCR